MKKEMTLPTIEQLERELKRETYRRRFGAMLRSTVYILVTVAALAILVSALFLPVLRIYGSSMTPTLSEGELVAAVKGARFQSGDLIAFYYNNKILVKRVIAGEGQWVDIDESGNVSVDHQALYEPYVEEKSLGECDIDLPYQVPSERFFVMGDHRETSVDSRSTAVGCVSRDQVIGKIVFRIWPLEDLGLVE